VVVHLGPIKEAMSVDVKDRKKPSEEKEKEETGPTTVTFQHLPPRKQYPQRPPVKYNRKGRCLIRSQEDGQAGKKSRVGLQQGCR